MDEVTNDTPTIATEPVQPEPQPETHSTLAPHVQHGEAPTPDTPDAIEHTGKELEALRGELAQLRAEGALRAQGVPAHLLGDLTKLLAESGQPVEEFLASRPWAKTPEPGTYSPNPPQRHPVTVDDLKHMTPAEINDQWEQLGKPQSQNKTRVKVKR